MAQMREVGGSRQAGIDLSLVYDDDDTGPHLTLQGPVTKVQMLLNTDEVRSIRDWCNTILQEHGKV